MAPRKKKVEEKVEKKVAEKVIVETYVVPMKRFNFAVPEIDEKTGSKIPLLDPLTGIQQRVDMRPQYMERVEKFITIIDNVQRGCLCQYIVYEDTPEPTKERLAELCADPTSDVMTREEWIKINNRPQYDEIQRRKEAEEEAFKRGLEEGSKAAKGANPRIAQELTAKDKIIAEQAKKIAELEKESE